MESNNSVLDVKEALNNYFKLKLNYEKKIQQNKNSIIKNKRLSNRDKRSEFLKLKPKCISCDRPGGTIFKVRYFPAVDNEESHRQYIATCGIIVEPCNLNFKINVGKIACLPTILDDIQAEIKELKDDIINNKNKLLFGYLTAEEVLSKFDDLESELSGFSSLYEEYLLKYSELVDNKKKSDELNEAIIDSVSKIEEIKGCIKKMNETNNTQFANDAANIYVTTLEPLLSKIRNLKYNETMVWHNEETNTCHLIQNKYSIEKLSYSSYVDNVVSLDIGVKTNKPNKKKSIKIAENIVKSEDVDEAEQANELDELEQLDDKPDEANELQNNEPIYNDNDVSWPNSKYEDVWKELPIRLKNSLRTNPEWMKAFMANCVNARANKQPCKIIAPKDLILPPELLPSGQYNFGVKIYSDAFNKLSKDSQKMYLTLNVEYKDGTKDWKGLINAMNELITNELGSSFSNGYF
jgi:hypothetical protein